MIEQIQFQAKARTIDHLGREQIADCPTAVSELWKNAYDAYASAVSLNLYSGEMPVAVICDDGHGMSYQEVKDKWLVVGTESKAVGGVTPVDDRNGLTFRPRQGKKGIGRLSCGYLGSLLLLVSKRKDQPFVAALIDWRLFENPYLLLQDILIPVATFETKDDLLKSLPDLFNRLMGNVWGDADDEGRKSRIEQAWRLFDEFELKDPSHDPNVHKTTREKIESTIIGAAFFDRHFQEWDAWNGKALYGTALLISNIDYTLETLLDEHAEDSIAKHARDKFFETLSGFSDPFSSTEQEQFECSAVVWYDGIRREVIGQNQFKLSDIEHLEHVLNGRVGEDGVFRGRVKSFGQWLEGEVEIPIHEDLLLPNRRDSYLGPFEIFLAAAERDLKNTTHTKEEFAQINSLADNYSGFMIYRDGLRVMPYGRSDNDFFEIEKRRSLHAGREFWNQRRLFGRVAISSTVNPNLRDKAGREGIVDNRAAKALNDIVVNILMISARRYFGSDSEIRQQILPELHNAYNKAKLENDRNNLRKKQRKDFRWNLRVKSPKLKEDLCRLEALLESAHKQKLDDEKTLFDLRDNIESFKEGLREYRLGQAPKNLGTLEDEYIAYRNNLRSAQNLITELNERISVALEVVVPKAPQDIAYSDLCRNANYLHQRISEWSKKLKSLLGHENERLSVLVESRNKLFHHNMSSIVEDVSNERVRLADALSLLEAEKHRLDRENEEIFEPYIAALEYLQESIDLQGLVTFGAEEVADLRDEVNRLNELAQLGITVEIVGHELASYDSTIASGLSNLPKDIKTTRAYNSIKDGFEGLSNRLKFLSPLKLSGERIQKWISGLEIEEYVRHFFGEAFSDKSILFEGCDSFRVLRLYDLPARIFPVFINLVNNAIYWVCQKPDDRRIIIDFVDGRVVVSDTGPGVEEDDIKSLFTLFFTRKIRGGRGVGLYLCRANLAASGHRIEYAVDDQFKLLDGANFLLIFKGIDHG